jgi:uncharacterized protein YkwD
MTIFHTYVRIAIALLVATPAIAQQDTFDIVNSLRVRECSHHLSRDRQLKNNGRLDTAAKYVNEGFGMREALRRADYRADQSAEVHMTGINDNNALRNLLARNYCKTLSDPALTEIGIARRGKEVAIVLAAPFAPPSPSDAAKVEHQVLQLVNDARSKPRRCGAKKFASAPPLALNDVLHVAAIAHAKDMARRGEVTHDGSDGSSPDQRATRAGYVWKTVGENVAGGQLTAQEVVDGWLSSPHHCENIMDPDFTQMAVAYIVNPNQKIGIYWAQEFGRPR